MKRDDQRPLPSGLIGIEELQPESCDGTGEDVMSMRARNKWHIVGTTNGNLAGSQATRDAERQAADDAAFGEWLYHQCHDSPDARRLFAKWQQRDKLAKRDVLPKETLVDALNLLTRVELDGWNTVSRKFHASTQCAQPLRPVFSAVLMHYRASDWPEKLFEAVFYVVNGTPAKRFNASDVDSLFTPFFGCLRFCHVKYGIQLQSIPIGRAFVDDLKAINKDFRIAAEYNTCQMYQVTFAEDVDPFDAITSFPSFRRHIATSTLASLVKHAGRLDDALLRSLAARGLWNVCIPDEKEKWGGWAEVLQQVDGSRITEDGVLDFAFGDYEDDDEGRALRISPEVPLSAQFFEKLVKACRNCMNIRKTEAIISTHREFDIAKWKPKVIPRLDDYWRDQYAHRPVWEFHFDNLPDLTVRYVRADPQAYYMPAARIQFWRNGASTMTDHVLYTGPRP